MKIGDITFTVSVTEENREQVLEGLSLILGEQAGPAEVDANMSATEAAPAAAKAEAAPRRPSRKAAEKAAAAAAAAEKPVEAPAAEAPAEPTSEAPAAATGNVWDEPGPTPAEEAKPNGHDAAAEAPLTMEGLNDRLNVFAGIHGVAATRRVIQSFGVTRLSELAEGRWGELLATLVKENGGKPLA